jgi:ADP-dependent NAD(P)H-hydrate dehydratase / NAD(P)H-hydrate epimerase
MKLPKAKEMQALDKCAINEFGIPGIVLMENAGLGTVQLMEKELGSPKDHFAVIFIGPGNNGGDGLVIARHLHQRDCVPILFFLVDPESLTGDAATNLNIIRKLKLQYHLIDSPNRVQTLPVLYKQIMTRGKPCYAFVDAMFGTGLARELTEHYADTIDIINSPHFGVNVPIVAVDIPSGLHADSGAILGCCINANHTFTYGCVKPGQIMHGSAEITGKLQLVDIGIPPEAIEKTGIPTELLTENEVAQWSKKLIRDKSSHKGNHGHLLIIAGSSGKTGAAILAAKGALRSGCGLVSLCVPNKLNTIFESQLTEAMTIPLPSCENYISDTDLDIIASSMKNKNAIITGPGLGTDPATIQVVLHLYNNATVPVVLDADALNILAEHIEDLKEPPAPRILTPHPGEMARLCQTTTSKIQGNRLQAARNACALFYHHKQVIIILKGDGTVIAHGSGEAMINTTGNPSMGTGGMGDVLTGIIGSFVCQGMTPLEAAAAGVYIHGKSADTINEVSGFGFTATEVADNIPNILKTYTQQEEACKRQKI